jgi:tRNA threonylcarbamoyladenosine biosynthesis protein TsaB
MQRGHAEALMPMVEDVLATAGERILGLDLLAVTIGPGAFTGLRVGLAAARGMALASALPCLGITSLEAVAHAIPDVERQEDTVLVVLNSRTKILFAQFFSAGLESLSSPLALAAEDLARDISHSPLLVAGDAAELVAQKLTETGIKTTPSSAPALPDAAMVAAIAARRWRPEQTVTPPFPLYLRPPAAIPAKNGGRP